MKYKVKKTILGKDYDDIITETYTKASEIATEWVHPSMGHNGAIVEFFDPSTLTYIPLSEFVHNLGKVEVRLLS